MLQSSSGFDFVILVMPELFFLKILHIPFPFFLFFLVLNAIGDNPDHEHNDDSHENGNDNVEIHGLFFYGI